MRVRFLGTSAAMPGATRSHVALLVEAERTLLLECGPTVPWQLCRLGLDHRRITDVFISHVHGDHSLGLPMLLTLGELDGRSWPLRVYCPASAVARLKTIGRACYPSLDRIMEEQVEWIAVPESGEHALSLSDGLLMRATAGIHGVPSVAYRFDQEGASLLYSGDTAPAPAVAELARNVRLLVHEATWSERIDGRTSSDHTSARQAGVLATEARAGRLALVHLHRDYAGREAELLAEAREGFRGEVLVPADGDAFDVPA